MAENDNTLVPVPSSPDDAVIKTINDNFRKLTERIKQTNINLSFLDLLKLTTTWAGSYDSSASSADSAADQRKQEFISTVWNTLSNYSGVYIQYTGITTQSYAFNFMGYTVNNGDFLIRLPGSQCLYIEGQKPGYYIPTSFNGVDGTIAYSLNNTGASSTSVTIPAIVSNYTVTMGTWTTALTNTIRDVRWFTESDEEVFWDGSYKATTPPAELRAKISTLQYIFLHKSS